MIVEAKRYRMDEASCWSDGYRVDSQGELVLVSLFGNRNSVRSLWATLVGGQKRSNPTSHRAIDIGGEILRCREERTYLTFQAPLGKARTHLVLMDTWASNQVILDASFFYQIGPNPEERFFSHLISTCLMPFRASWQKEIWQLGLENDLIKSLFGFGLPVHKVTTTLDAWVPVMREGVQSGRLR